jgi:hypothetical protein
VSTPETMEAALRRMYEEVRRMPRPVQEDIETVARSFRNTLAAGDVAVLALMIVAAEVSIAAKRRGTPFL